MSDECNKFAAEAEAEAKRGDHSLSAEKLKNAGFCYFDIEDFVKASECFRKSAEESLVGKNKIGASDSFLNAVITSLRSGNKEEAAESLKAAESKGLGGTDNLKLAAALLKVASSKVKSAKQKVANEFSFLIQDNYWLRKALEKLGISASST